MKKHNDKLPSAFKVVKQHLKRWGSRQPGFEQLEDPRSPVNRVWSFDYRLEVRYGGLLSGCKTGREVETFSDIDGERVPESTLHAVLLALDGRDVLPDAIIQAVKAALPSHELPKEAFPVRITAIEGKSTSDRSQRGTNTTTR